jgi:hypothetical protein
VAGERDVTSSLARLYEPFNTNNFLIFYAAKVMHKKHKTMKILWEISAHFKENQHFLPVFMQKT